MDINEVVTKVIHEMAEAAVKNVIADKRGYGIETEIKTIIKEEARRLLQEDDDIKAALRKAVIYWIKDSS